MHLDIREGLREVDHHDRQPRGREDEDDDEDGESESSLVVAGADPLASAAVTARLVRTRGQVDLAGCGAQVAACSPAGSPGRAVHAVARADLSGKVTGARGSRFSSLSKGSQLRKGPIATVDQIG